MMAVIFFSNRFYCDSVSAKIISEPGTFGAEGTNAFVANAVHMMNVHAVLLCITGVLLIFLPLYGHLIRKINTNIAVEENQEMGALDLTGDDA